MTHTTPTTIPTATVATAATLTLLTTIHYFHPTFLWLINSSMMGGVEHLHARKIAYNILDGNRNKKKGLGNVGVRVVT
jgi:acyl-[acyl carrier protein]--UDP-N-acetylglucosamine O-acyltransferase